MSNVAGYIQRKTMLYETGVEYGDYTINFVLGCAHGCKYPCYAFMMKKRFGVVKTYDDWCKPFLVENTLGLLDKEIPRLKSKIESVQLCFSTDPFMYGYPEIEAMALAAIRKLNAADIKCTVLTKGILPEELAGCSLRNEYGITLVSLDEEYRKKYEPGAAPLSLRLAALKKLSDLGCNTWVSIEPYPTPNIINQDLHQLLNSVGFVGRIIFGRTNYSKEVTAYTEHKAFYNECAEIVTQFCNDQRIKLHLKDGTVT